MNDRAPVLPSNSSPVHPYTRGSGPRSGGTPREPRPFSGTSRFEPRGLIGRGGMGVVYRVHDGEMGIDVALKTLPVIDPGDIVHLKNEFRILLELTHPNLIELHELFVEGDEAFFTMELLDGHSFVSHVRGRESKETDIGVEPHGVWMNRLTNALVQLVDGVTFLHRAGKLHCDIKPSNVRVTSSSRVVLLDFGLAMAIVADGASHGGDGTMQGTVEYMAPEQAWGEILTPAADWYAVGVMLYEALLGRLPFQGEFGEIITNKTRIRPTAPIESMPSIPRALSDLVLNLLHPNPEKRASGKDILAVVWSLDSTVVKPDVDVVARDAPFVGREIECLALRSAYEKAIRNGAPMLVRIEGASGMGKTELVRHFISRLENESSALVLRGRCHPRESVPYKAFDGVIDTLSHWLSDLPSEDVPHLAPEHGRAVLRVFRSLSAVPGLTLDSHTDEPPEPQELRRRAFDGLRLLLGNVATRIPLIIWIDDLQWSDVDSLALLRELLAAVRGPILFLLGYRSEEIGHSPILQELARVATSRPSTISENIRLGPLGEASARSVVASILGSDSGDEGALLESIAAEAAGSPFFLVELARYVAQRAEDNRPVDETRTRFVDVIRARIEGLRPEERRLLEVTSIAGGPIDRSLALRVAGLGERGRPDAVRLGQACLLRSTEIEGRPAIETYHDRIREALLAHFPLEESQKCHLTLAHALRENPDTDPEALFRHYLGGGDLREAGQFAMLAAERADSALAFDRAAELYQKALDLAVDILPQWKLRERLAEALTNAGRGVDAADAFRTAAETANQADAGHDSVLDLERRAAEQFLRSGYNDQGMGMMRTVLARVGVEVPGTSSKAMRVVALARIRLLARGLGFTPKNIAEVPQDVLGRLDALWGFSTSISMMNHTLADALGVWHLLEALHWGERSRVARALGYEASFEAALGGRIFRWRSEGMLKKVTELAQETGNPYDEAWSHMAIGTSAWLGAQWTRTVRHCDLGEAIFRQKCRGATWELAILDLYALSALSQLGQMRALGRRLPRALRDAQAHGDLFAANNFRLGQMSIVWLAGDRPDYALALAQEAENSWRAENYHTQRYHHIIGLAQTMLYMGQACRSHERLEEEWPKLEAAQFLMLETPRVELWHLRARTALAILAAKTVDTERDVARLKKSCREAARRIDSATVPTAKPFAALIRAGLARLEGNRNKAENELRAAIAYFDQAQMAMYREASRWCLGEIVGGDAGRNQLEASRAWMAHEEIRRPETMVDMLLPACREGF